MSIQDHCHIALTLSGSPEYSPIHSWKVTSYQEVPEVLMSQKRTSSGKSRTHVIRNASGPIQFMNYQLTLKCLDDNSFTARQYKAFLEAMNGRDVYFVDIDHVASGVDHTPYVKLMTLKIDKERPMTPMLNYYQIDVELTDNHTVS